MGNTICIKCGVDRNYYKDNITPSCRVHTYKNTKLCCNNNGNCSHIFRFQFYGTFKKYDPK